MADVQAQTLRGVFAGLAERGRQQVMAQPATLVGGLIEKMTGQVESYNKKLEDHAKIKLRAHKITQQLNEVDKQREVIRRKIVADLFKEEKAAEKAREELERLTERTKELRSEQEGLAESLNESTQELRDLNQGSGILSNGLTVLAAKVGGAAAAFFSWREMLESIDDRMKLAGNQVASMGATTDGYLGSLRQVTDAAWEWNRTINQSTWELTKYGINAEETRNIIGTLADGLRLTTEDQGQLAQMTNQVTQDLGFMSKLLQVNTDELATATVDASRRFGKSTQAMSNDLAGLYDAISTIKQTSKDTVVSFSDLARATFEAQASFQGYNFNLKGTGALLANIVAKAQEQGATYEASLKAAKGLTDVIAGTAAPKWARFVAGKELRQELVQVVNAAKQSGTDIQQALKQAFGDELTKAQLTGLQHMAENWREHGDLSSAEMTQEMLAGTRKGMKALFKQIRSTTRGKEAKQVLQQVWGLDPQAATAAAIMIKGMRKEVDRTDKEAEDDFFERLTQIRKEGEAATVARRPPTVADLKNEIGKHVMITAAATQGMWGTLKNIFDMLKQNPFISGAMGLGGAALAGGLELLQTGLPAALAAGVATGRMGGVARMAGAPFRAVGRGLGMAGRGLSAAGGAVMPALKFAATRQFRVRDVARAGVQGARALPGMARAGLMVAPELAGRGLAAARALPGATMAGIRGAPAAMVGLAKAAGPAIKGLAGMGGMLLKVAGPVGAVAAAGAIGYGIGKMLYKHVPIVKNFGDALGKGAASLFGFKDTISDAEAAMQGLANKSKGVQDAISQIQKGIIDDYDKDSFARMKAVVQLQAARDEDLKGYAKQIAERSGMDEEQLMERLKALRAEKVDAKKMQKARQEFFKALSPEEVARRVKQEARERVGARREDESVAAYEARLKAEEAAARERIRELRGELPLLPGKVPEVEKGRGAREAERARGRARRKARPPPVVTVEALTDEQKRAVTQQVAETLAPEMRETAQTLFQQMAQQSTSYFEQSTQASQWFWTTHMPESTADMWTQISEGFGQHYQALTDSTTMFWEQHLPTFAEEAWDRIVTSLQDKLGIFPTAVPIEMVPDGDGGRDLGGGGGRAGRVGGRGGATMGAASVGADGTIRLQIMIPRDAIDTSNAVSANYTE